MSYEIDPLDILKKYWGYEKFLPSQEEIIQGILNREDLLVLLPTGGGKSICFQIPALMQEGLCLVVSPLIALMRDQVTRLQQKRIPSDYISSERSEKEINMILDNATYGKTRLLYVSPERLQNRKFLERLKHLKISFIVIDEAHCISQWGYDFRPSYLKVSNLRKIFPQTPFLAFTASATPQTVDDIMEKLAFKTKKFIRKSFLRENLSYQVLRSDNKFCDLKFYLIKHQGTAIIYVRNRNKTKKVSDHLNMNGFQADYYHAGLTSEEKKHKEENWQKGHIRIIVATSAFGLGIDKANVRLVCHWDLPDSVESYFQEVGRGGRCGQDAYGILFYNERDIQNNKDRLLKGLLNKKNFQNICQKLFDHYQISPGECPDKGFSFDLSSFAQRYKQKKKDVAQIIGHLERSGVLQITEKIYVSIQLKCSLQQIEALSSKEGSYRHVLDQFARRHPKMANAILEIPLSNISKTLNQKPFELEILLEQLQKKGLVAYEKSLQRLNFILPRDDRQIEKSIWNSYKKNQEQRHGKFQALTYYVTKKSLCRSRLLLSYFGEKRSIACGRCDVCPKNEKSVNKKELLTYSAPCLKKVPENLKISC